MISVLDFTSGEKYSLNYPKLLRVPRVVEPPFQIAALPQDDKRGNHSGSAQRNN